MYSKFASKAIYHLLSLDLNGDGDMMAAGSSYHKSFSFMVGCKARANSQKSTRIGTSEMVES